MSGSDNTKVKGIFFLNQYLKDYMEDEMQFMQVCGEVFKCCQNTMAAHGVSGTPEFELCRSKDKVEVMMHLNAKDKVHVFTLERDIFAVV